jgi:hypothetical protein
MKRLTKGEHLRGPGPKRILALDGGGVRGIVSLGYLASIEKILRARYDDQTLTLSDYFDLIGGTSTGAIIATGLALGFSVERLQQLYKKLAGSVFERSWLRHGLLRTKFPAGPLRAALADAFRDLTLDSDEVRTGLMIMLKRYDTGSPWVIHNHPDGRYFDTRPDSTAVPNRKYQLANLVRASTAAPTYFMPEILDVTDGEQGAFIDGGTTTANNPALQLFMLSTIKRYGWGWEKGADKLLLISVGTGFEEPLITAQEVADYYPAEMGIRSLLSLMEDCSWLAQTILQWNARMLTPREIDREIGDLSGDSMSGTPLLTYARYDLRFDPKWLREELDYSLDAEQAAHLALMDEARNVDMLSEIGIAAGQHQVKEDHLPGVFDLPGG